MNIKIFFEKKKFVSVLSDDVFMTTRGENLMIKVETKDKKVKKTFFVLKNNRQQFNVLVD